MTGTNAALGHAMQSDPRMGQVYDPSFYKGQVASSLQSARVYLKHLWQFIRPRSVLDVGCGRGAWLQACHELGSEMLVGYDGDWNSQSQMIDSTIRFHSIDLNQPFSTPQKADLAVSLEVAEHLLPASSEQFVRCLTETADAVLFSAAYPGQGGTNHINEQLQSYWARLFARQGFVPFDLFRPVFWGNKDVCFWYRQNTFLYCRDGSPAGQQVKAKGAREIGDPAFMDCVHPDLFDLRNENGFMNHLTDLAPSLWRAMKRRLT